MLKFFRNLASEQSPEALKECLKHCRYAFVAQDNFVMRQNEPGDKFYIILNGKVKILKLDPVNQSKKPTDQI